MESSQRIPAAFQIRTREDYITAGEVLEYLRRHFDDLTPEQVAFAKALALQIARCRTKDLGDE